MIALKMSVYQEGKEQKPACHVQFSRHPPSLHVSDFVSIWVLKIICNVSLCVINHTSEAIHDHIYFNSCWKFDNLKIICNSMCSHKLDLCFPLVHTRIRLECLCQEIINSNLGKPKNSFAPYRIWLKIYVALSLRKLLLVLHFFACHLSLKYRGIELCKLV